MKRPSVVNWQLDTISLEPSTVASAWLSAALTNADVDAALASLFLYNGWLRDHLVFT